MVEKKFETLYTIDSKGKIRVFECEVQSSESTELGKIRHYQVCTSTGLLGGKLIQKKERVVTGKNKGKKNETTPLDQALLQADSLWRCKWQEGYKSESFLYKAFKDRYEVELTTDLYKRLYMIFEAMPVAAYTNENWDYLPMLASKWKDIKKKEYPMYAQPKFNGVRNITIWDSEKQRMKLISRGGTYYKIPHIEEQMLKIMMLINETLPGHYLFDGELYKHNTLLQEISGAARTEVDGMFASNDWLEYHIYDVIDLGKIVQTQRERLTNLIAIQTITRDKFPNIRFVKTKIVLDEQEVDDLHDEYLEQGYEGLILRTRDGKYEFNQRSKSLIKVKKFQDEEFEIIGFEIDPNKTIEESFVFILRNNTNDKTFKSRPTGTNEMKQKWYNDMLHKKYIGSYATVRFQERSKDDLPIQGHVRADLTEVLNIRPKHE